MKTTLKLEELSILALLCLLYFQWLDESAVFFFLLFFTPDLGMLGYLVNTRVGAICYNILHHRGVMCALVVIGYISSQAIIGTIGIIYLAHISFDRMLGYGLKYPDSFHNTHLGRIGKEPIDQHQNSNVS